MWKSLLFATTLVLCSVLFTPGAHAQIILPEANRSPRVTGQPPTGQFVSTSSQTTGVAVQIGAFRTRQRADRLGAILQKGGYTAYVLEADIPGLGLYYRVRVGPLDTQEEAREVASRMRSRFPKEIPGFWSVPYQQ